MIPDLSSLCGTALSAIDRHYAYPFIGSIDDFVRLHRPSIPVYFYQADVLKQRAALFQTGCWNRTLYAVKCNPHPFILKNLYDAGITEFDVASLTEAALIRQYLPADAGLYFMHPVKSFQTIKAAYYNYGVRVFALDSLAELEKIMAATDNANDLTLVIRFTLTHNHHSALPLKGKFGVEMHALEPLLKACKEKAHKVGLAFHVGSQAMDVSAWESAIAQIAEFRDQIDVLDIGGGFPARYPDMDTKPLEEYFAAIKGAITEHGFENHEIWSEPGRAMVADCGSLLIQVIQKRGDALYVNDGVFGGLYDASDWIGFNYYVSAHSLRDDVSNNLKPYRFFGPTCDSDDQMQGPFLLPCNIYDEDWINIQSLGAYSYSMRSDFNGYNDYIVIDLKKER
jgi:ornithine decarboxylase